MLDVTSIMDWLLLAALLTQVALGFSIALIYRWRADWLSAHRRAVESAGATGVAEEVCSKPLTRGGSCYGSTER